MIITVDLVTIPHLRNTKLKKYKKYFSLYENSLDVLLTTFTYMAVLIIILFTTSLVLIYLTT